MRAWAYMLGGLIVWTVHFFAVYIVASVFLTTTIARITTAIVTVGCLVANGWLVMHLRRPSGGDEFSEWMRKLALTGAGLSAIAVIWQGLPSLIV
jgi:hypothetical protein